MATTPNSPEVVKAAIRNLLKPPSVENPVPISAEYLVQSLEQLIDMLSINTWVPIFGVVDDGPRQVWQVVDWQGGTGIKPAVGQYLSATGYTNTISQAVDLRGPAGLGLTGYETATYPYAVVDSQGRIAFYVDNAGRLCTPQVGDLSSFLLTLQAGLTPLLPPTGVVAGDYAEVHVDQANRIAYFVDLAGRLGTPLIPDLAGAIVALQTGVAPLLPPKDVVAGNYGEVHVDQANRIAYFVDLAGRLGTPAVPNIAGAILALQSAIPYEWNPESGYAWAITDQTGKVAIGIDLSGNVLIKGKPFLAYVSDYVTSLITPFSVYVNPSRNVACWGDSLTEAGWPAIFTSLINDGRTAYNGGTGGDTSTQVAFRQGGLCVSMQVAGNQIPASGAVVVTPANANIIQVGRNVSVTGTLMGVSGTLIRLSDGSYTFTRSSAGSAVVTDKNVMFGSNGGGHDTKTVVLWAGRNNYSDPTIVVADIARMVAFLKVSNKRFVILSVLNGDFGGETIGLSGYDKIVNQINGVLRTTYPRNYIDVRELLIRNYNPALTQDVTDFNNDVVPTSLRIDGIHLTNAGYTLVAQAVKSFFTQNNW